MDPVREMKSKPSTHRSVISVPVETSKGIRSAPSSRAPSHRAAGAPSSRMRTG